MAGVRVAIVTESFLPTGNGVTTSVCRIRQHGLGPVGRGAARAAWRWVRRLHCLADLTLAPSTAALEDLRAHGIPSTALWARGVDTALFHPGWRGDAGTRALRRTLAPDGEVLLGYVGRLAPEKELHRLAEARAGPADAPGPRRRRPEPRGCRCALLAAAVSDAPGRPNRPAGVPRPPRRRRPGQGVCRARRLRAPGLPRASPRRAAARLRPGVRLTSTRERLPLRPCAPGPGRWVAPWPETAPAGRARRRRAGPGRPVPGRRGRAAPGPLRRRGAARLAAGSLEGYRRVTRPVWFLTGHPPHRCGRGADNLTDELRPRRPALRCLLP